MAPSVPVVLIKADTVISASVATSPDGSKYGRIWIGGPEHTPPMGGEGAIIINSPDTLESLAEVLGTLANDLRRATS